MYCDEEKKEMLDAARPENIKKNMQAIANGRRNHFIKDEG